MPGPVLVVLGVYVAYVGLVAALWRAKRVDYLQLASSAQNVRDGIVVPIGLGLTLLVVATTALGWWDDVLRQNRTGPAWVLAVPAALLLTALAGVLAFDRASAGARRLPLIGAAVLLVGAAEELLARGLLLTAAREAGWTELAAFLFSTGLFALLHVLNGFFGMPGKAVGGQVVLSFLGGAAFYATLMSTGLLVVCVLLHALWDFATLGTQATGRTPRPAQVVLGLLTYVLAVAGTWAVLAT